MVFKSKDGKFIAKQYRRRKKEQFNRDIEEFVLKIKFRNGKLFFSCLDFITPNFLRWVFR